MAKEMISITKAEYEELKDAERWARALDNAGVNNWEGYEIAKDFKCGYDKDEK